MFYCRKGPSINFLGPGKRRFPGGSPAGYPARKVYVYVVFSHLAFEAFQMRVAHFCFCLVCVEMPLFIWSEMDRL